MQFPGGGAPIDCSPSKTIYLRLFQLIFKENDVVLSLMMTMMVVMNRVCTA